MKKFSSYRILIVSIALFLMSFGPALSSVLCLANEGKYTLINNIYYLNLLYSIIPLLFIKLNWHTIDPQSDLNFSWTAFFKIFSGFLAINAIVLAAEYYFLLK